MRGAPLLYCITDVRLITFRSAILARLVRISSCTPSVKKAFAFSSLRFSNGSTAIDFALMTDFDSLGTALATSAASRLRREHELVERKIAKRQDQHHDDHAVHPSPGLRSDRLLGRHILLALQALRR